MTEEPSDQQRRKPPADRFSGPARVISVSEVAEQLDAEAGPARNGHRQSAVVRGETITQLVFSFETGGHLAPMSVPVQESIARW